jgi:predicted phage terminase large subunit-like protein
LLQPNRDNAQTLDDIKREVGSRIFGAQYQQNPTPPDGNMINASWLRRYASMPPRGKFRTVVLSCDPAGKAGIKNDYTAITVVGVDAKELYLLHVRRGHWTILEMRNQIITLASQWTVTHVIVENTASGMGLVQLLQEQTSLPVFGDHPKDDKETRLSRHQGRFEAGRILLPVDAPWLADFEIELLAFPNGRYDDQVDALLLFLDWFTKNEHRLKPMSFTAPIIIYGKRTCFGDMPPLF